MIKINIGDRFGHLTVLSEVPKAERPNPTAGRYYKCQCDCGNVTIVYGHNLKTGNTKSCGCLSRQTSSENNSIDIPIGTEFGLLTVIERAPIHDDHLAYWKCRCTCGAIVEVSGHNLRTGRTKSCGANQHRSSITPGDRFSKLTVLQYEGHRNNGGSIWKCQCDCGQIAIVRGDSLTRGHTRSCGCTRSFQEELITKLLIEYKINYSRQYTFTDLKSEKNGTLRFDFAIFNSSQELMGLIEYQGEQHYDLTSSWYSAEARQRDQMKVDYCKKHNIPLYIWDKNTNIEESIKQLKDIVGEE